MSGCCENSRGLLLFQTLVRHGHCPEKIAAREGLQAVDGQCALENKIPRLAKRSIFGVSACGWPPRQPTQSLRSSTAIITTLGVRDGSTTCTGRSSELADDLIPQTRTIKLNTKRLPARRFIDPPFSLIITADPIA